jgi:hypothetical protein
VDVNLSTRGDDAKMSIKSRNENPVFKSAPHRRVLIVFFLGVALIALFAFARNTIHQVAPVITLLSEAWANDTDNQECGIFEGLPGGLSLFVDLRLIRCSGDQGIYEYVTALGSSDLCASLESGLMYCGWQTMIPDECDPAVGYGYLLAFPQNQDSDEKYLFFQWEEGAEGTLVLLQREL